jgi:hypothetical protein
MAGQREVRDQATLPSQSNDIGSDAEGVKRLVYWGRPGGSPGLRNGRISQLAASPHAEGALEGVRTYVREAGRDPAAFGVEGRLHLGTTPQESWPQAVEMWRRLGGTHLAVNTMRSGLKSPDQHVAALRRFRDAVRHLV